MADTAARVDMIVRDSGDWSDAFRFGTEGDTSWNFTDCDFIMEVKGDSDESTALLTMSTGNGKIVVDDETQRVLHFVVPQADLEAALVPGIYVYDLIMIDNITTVRTPLMYGKVKIKRGVTQS